MAFDIPGLTFLKAHENLVITVIVAFTLLYGVGKVLDYKTNHDQKKLDVLQGQLIAAQKAADDAKIQVASISASAAADRQANALVQAQQQQQINLLTAAMAARDKATAGQINVDLHAGVPYLTQRLMKLVPALDPKDVAISKDAKSITLGQDSTQKVTGQLEKVPTLEQDLADSKQQTKDVQIQLTSQQNYTAILEKLQAAQANLITLQEKTLALSDKTCDARVKVADDKGNKKFVKGLKWGAILGVVGGIAAHVFIH